MAAWYWGLAALGAGAAAGAAIGAATAPDCGGSGDAFLFCGPRVGAVLGVGTGLLLVGIAGLGAAISKDYRAPGLTAAGAVALLVAASAIASPPSETS